VIAPPFAGNVLQHIEFVLLTDERALVVMVFASNIIQHKIIRLDEPLTQAELERTARYLNAEFAGKTLIAIRAEILHLLREEKRHYDAFLKLAVLLTERSFADDETTSGDVFIDGASNMLTKPDFTDVRGFKRPASHARRKDAARRNFE
jgi:heat-inducible transcriptional repressor